MGKEKQTVTRFNPPEMSVAEMEARLIELPREIWEANKKVNQAKANIENQEGKIAGIEARAIRKAISEAKAASTIPMLVKAITIEETEKMREQLGLFKADYQSAKAEMDRLINEHLSIRAIGRLKNQI